MSAPSFTPREREILAAVTRGATNKAIAHQYGIKEQAVKNYLTAIYDKVGVSNRVALTVVALQRHLIDRKDHG
jgi:DNA-binding NarL/FixJ family response regulator